MPGNIFRNDRRRQSFNDAQHPPMLLAAALLAAIVAGTGTGAVVLSHVRGAAAAEADPARDIVPGSGQTFRDRLADGTPCPHCPELVIVPSGSFMLGSPDSEPERRVHEGPIVSVSFARPFAVGKLAVTRGEFAAFVQATGHKADGCVLQTDNTPVKFEPRRSWRSPGYAQDDRHPVVCVNWDDAKAYAGWLTRQTGKTYRLLTEAEREYAARAGTTTPFWWGSAITSADANYGGMHRPYIGGGTKGRNLKRTVSASAFKPNPWGLHNVHGNIWEWTEDCWQSAPTAGGQADTAKPFDCKQRTLRGGSWGASGGSVRAASRLDANASERDNTTGLRVARSLAE